MSTLPPFVRPFPNFGRKPAQAAPAAEVPPMPAHPPVVVAELPAIEESATKTADAAAETTDTSARRTALRRRRAQGAAPAAGAVAPVREPNPRLRWALYNAAAAGAGHLAIWAVAGDPLAGANLMARMTISIPELAAAGLTLVAAYGGWRAGGFLRGLPGLFGMAMRPLGAIGAALWGQGTAPLVRNVMDAVEPWGTVLSPLLAVGPVAAACWYGLDRRAAAAQLIPPVRWVLRIPLATVVVSSLLYTPGVVL